MVKNESGLIRFLPLLLVALLLIGVVGYVSFQEIKNSPKSEVLSESSTNTKTDDTSVSENELDSEDKGLNDVEDLQVDIPGLKTETPVARPVQTSASEPETQTTTGSERAQTQSQERKSFSVFDFFDSLLKKLGSLHF